MIDFNRFAHGHEDMIRLEVRDLVERGNVTLDEWKNFRGNSYEFELLYPKLTDEAFIYAGRHVVKNCQFERLRPWRSYNESCMGFVAPESLTRLEKANATLNEHAHLLARASRALIAAADIIRSGARDVLEGELAEMDACADDCEKAAEGHADLRCESALVPLVVEMIETVRFAPGGHDNLIDRAETLLVKLGACTNEREKEPRRELARLVKENEELRMRLSKLTEGAESAEELRKRLNRMIDRYEPVRGGHPEDS